MNKHQNGIPECPLCSDKLKQAHPIIATWFRDIVKTTFPDCHISWSYRDKANQDECFKDGKSKLQYPNSMHNKVDDKGAPSAHALDLFRLCSNGMASWEWKFFRDIASRSEEAKAPITWGGEWKAFADSDHFELTSAK